MGFHQRHGLRKHPLYNVWDGMKRRCHNSDNPHYKNYGGRGITIFAGWINNFRAFYNWAIANGWKKGLWIDRINNDGNYRPENCRFVTSAVNNQNRRSTKLNWDKVKGIRLCGGAGFSQTEIAKYYSVSRANICEILHNNNWRV